MLDALQSLWRELLGSWWVLAALPILLILRWLLISRWRTLARRRASFFSGSTWDAILPASDPAAAKKADAPAEAPDPSEFRRRWFLELVESALVALVLVFFIIRPFVVQAFYIPSPSMVETLQINDRILVNKFIYRLHPPNRHDVVVFQPPHRATENVGDDWIKRVIGIPGDRIAVRNNHLYLNGVKQDEPYVALLDRATDQPDTPHQSTDRYDYSFPKFELPPGQNAYVYLPAGGTVMDGPFDVKLTSDKNPKPLGASDQDYMFFIRNDPKEGPEAVVPPGYLFVMGDNRNDSEDSHFWGYLSEKRVLGQAFCIFWPIPRVRMLTHSSTPQSAPTGS